MRNTFSAALSLTAILSASLADARPRRVIVIQGRSFLDSGRQVPVGSQQNYVTQATTLNQPIYQSFRPDSFGNDVLPGRFGGIGR